MKGNQKDKLILRFQKGLFRTSLLINALSLYVKLLFNNCIFNNLNLKKKTVIISHFNNTQEKLINFLSSLTKTENNRHKKVICIHNFKKIFLQD